MHAKTKEEILGQIRALFLEDDFDRVAEPLLELKRDSLFWLLLAIQAYGTQCRIDEGVRLREKLAKEFQLINRFLAVFLADDGNPSRL